jgi:predicted metal-dependent hydrolase
LTGEIELRDGRRVRYRLRASRRSKSVRLRLSPRDGLVVTAPLGVRADHVADLVARQRDWVLGHLRRLEALLGRLGADRSSTPAAFALPALGESWTVSYVSAPGRAVRLREPAPGHLEMVGAVDDPARCRNALRRWMFRRATAALGPWLAALAAETGLHYSRLVVKCQRARWGSCSARGVISLNCKLLFLAPELVRHVLVHELCHTVELNHSARFWALVRRFEPDAAARRLRMRDAWRDVPAWAEPPSDLDETF